MTPHSSKAFTLAEVLIALVLLGVVAAFAIPKVLQALSEQQRTAVLKESLSSLNQLLTTGIAENEPNVSNYILTHLNSAKICDTNATTQGCWNPGVQNNGMTINETTQPGVILSNGAVLVGFDPDGNTTPYWQNTKGNGVLIDWNGEKGANRLGDDQLAVWICTSDRCAFQSTNANVCTDVPDASGPFTQKEIQFGGTVFPINNVASCSTSTTGGLYGPARLAENRRLFDSLLR